MININHFNEFVYTGKTRDIADLIDDGIDLNVQNELDESPLYIASQNGKSVLFTI